MSQPKTLEAKVIYRSNHSQLAMISIMKFGGIWERLGLEVSRMDLEHRQVLTIEYMDRNINIGKGRSQGDERSFRLITISFNRCSTGSGLGKDLSAALIRIQTLLPIYKAHASEGSLH